LELPAKSAEPRRGGVRHRGFSFALAFLALLLVTFIVLPLAKVIFFSDKASLWQAATDSATMRSIGLTLFAALSTTAIGIVLGVPLAYLLARRRFFMRSVVEAVVQVPVVVPHTAAGVALLFVFGRNFLLGRAASFIGLHFVDSFAGIVIAMLFVSVPFLINSAKEGFVKVDVRLENVARTLGATPRQTFFSVSLPLASRSIMAGGLMMWARGISEFGAVVVLAYYPTVTPTLIYQRFESYGLTEAIPVAALLIMVCAAIFILVRVALRKAESDD
jgi:molybdate/tungstate transport system permease protein